MKWFQVNPSGEKCRMRYSMSRVEIIVYQQPCSLSLSHSAHSSESLPSGPLLFRALHEEWRNDVIWLPFPPNDCSTHSHPPASTFLITTFVAEAVFTSPTDGDGLSILPKGPSQFEEYKGIPPSS
ncbi:hypothetical protein TNCV_1300031 [Trichonephila clavipes]|nr:hypothetical protein TNCV_1300031 [Trichonephila clavipes]